VSLDFRLVPHQTPQQIQSLFETQLQRAGYTITHEEPAPEFRRDHSRVIRVDWHSGGYESFKTPLEQPIARQVYDLMRESFGAPVYRVPLLGGSLPVAIYSRVLRTPLVILPIANYDNNQHGSNENLRLDNLWSAIDLLVSLYAHL
jgi:acetylornithine deacetylase/succinyl-diaminopimelate desuccinylase-like protein